MSSVEMENKKKEDEVGERPEDIEMKPTKTDNVFQPNDEDDEIENAGCFSRAIERIENAIEDFFSTNKTSLKKGAYASLLIGYLAYFIYCMQYRFGDEGSIVLLVITIFLIWKLLFDYLGRKNLLNMPKSFHHFIASKRGKRARKLARYFSYILAIAMVGTYLGVNVFPENPQNIQSFVGMFALIFACFLMSEKPSQVNWHPVFWSFIIQFFVATLTLRTTFGYNMFKWLGDQIKSVLAFSDSGSMLVLGKNFSHMGLAFSASGMIIFINAILAVLNHLGVIQFVVVKIGRFLSFCLDTGPVESVIAAANIFVGSTEAALLIRSYLPTVTRSELHTIMTCGFASISGGVMAFFISLGAPANHLITAAVISAPAALAISKLMCPERETISDDQKNLEMVDTKQSNMLNAFSEGAAYALKIVAAVWTNMLAFVSVIGLLNFVCVWTGERAGVEGLSFELICSYLMYPISYAMGIAEEDCLKVGSLIGVKLFATPAVSYKNLGDLIKNKVIFDNYTLHNGNGTWYWSGDDIILGGNTTLVNGIISDRSAVISTYAMCGFSAFSSIGICLGSLGSVVPKRKPEIIDLVLRAFIAGNMASFATGATAGMLFTS